MQGQGRGEGGGGEEERGGRVGMVEWARKEEKWSDKTEMSVAED